MKFNPKTFALEILYTYPYHSGMKFSSFHVEENEEIPCDLVLLCSSDSNGHSYIQTSNIDGEANLKLRKVPEVLRESLQSDSQEQIQKN